MTLPAAPNPISLSQIKTEFGPSRGYSNAISHYRNVVLERPLGVVSFSEFRGRTAEYRYAGYVGPPTSGTGHNIPIETAWGTAQVGWSNSSGSGGFFSITYYLYEGGGAAVWNHFVRVELTNGVHLQKSQFLGPLQETPQPKWSFMYINLFAPDGPIPAGNIYWVFQ
jgi:hypothetical protein